MLRSPDEINGLVLVKGWVSGPLLMQNLTTEREKETEWADAVMSVYQLWQGEIRQTVLRDRADLEAAMIWRVELNFSGWSQRAAVWGTLSQSQERKRWGRRKIMRISSRYIILFYSWIKRLLYIFWPEFIVCCCCFFHAANLHSKNSFCFAPSFEIQVSQWTSRLCPERSSASQKCLLNLNSNLWQC